MKIKKIEQPNLKIITLQILKLYSELSIHKKQKSYMQIQIYLNKISNILYEYSINSKNILFIGFPANFKNVLKYTKHTIIPEFIFYNGMITNRFSTKEIAKSKMDSMQELLLLLQIKKIDLIVIYNHNNKSTIIKEGYNVRIPIINISNTFNFSNKIAYSALGYYSLFNDKVTNNNFILSFLKTIINKTKKKII